MYKHCRKSNVSFVHCSAPYLASPIQHIIHTHE